MANTPTERSGSLVEAHKGYDPRTLFFYFAVAALLLSLASGLAYQQLIKTDEYHERERQQNQRRILVPGPRGNIYDRQGRLLVGNRPRFAVTIHLDELRKEFRREYIKIRKNYRALGDKDIPSSNELAQIARYSVVQTYLDKVNAATGRSEKVNASDLNRHFHGELLLPYNLVDDLNPEEYARVIEQLPVQSPLQIYASSTRHYPYGSAASHVLGYVVANDEIEADDNPANRNLAIFNEKNTFKMHGTVGRDGIESEYDNLLQGDTGGTVYRVDPAGYRVEPPIYRRVPVQGKSITTSLDIDLQMVAEHKLSTDNLIGAAAAIDINTGEVLALASKPDYDLNLFSPRLSSAAAKKINEDKAWMNHATQGVWPPGSTFKILVSIAGMRSGAIDPDTSTSTCTGYMKIGNRMANCDNGEARHGELSLREAIAQSCDIYYYAYGLQMTSEVIAAEARRFHLDRPTGIELPSESRRMLIPDPTWKKTKRGDGWVPGDTANMAIGQGFVLVSPLQMACFTASIARKETFTQPTLEHRAEPRAQHNEPIGLTAYQYSALIDGMEGCITHGTAKILTRPEYQIPGVRIVGKTGTSQIPGDLNIAWFICFAPREKPEIAVAVAVQGDTPGETFGGGRYAAPIAIEILKKYFEKKRGVIPPIQTEPSKPAIALPPR